MRSYDGKVWEGLGRWRGLFAGPARGALILGHAAPISSVICFPALLLQRLKRTLRLLSVRGRAIPGRRGFILGINKRFVLIIVVLLAGCRHLDLIVLVLALCPSCLDLIVLVLALSPSCLGSYCDGRRRCCNGRRCGCLRRGHRGRRSERGRGRRRGCGSDANVDLLEVHAELLEFVKIHQTTLVLVVLSEQPLGLLRVVVEPRRRQGLPQFLVVQLARVVAVELAERRV